ncbi:hypothetical protein ACVWYN_000022 [Pedobacter sp. UYP24]
MDYSKYSALLLKMNDINDTITQKAYKNAFRKTYYFMKTPLYTFAIWQEYYLLTIVSSFKFIEAELNTM